MILIFGLKLFDDSQFCLQAPFLRKGDTQSPGHQNRENDSPEYDRGFADNLGKMGYNEAVELMVGYFIHTNGVR